MHDNNNLDFILQLCFRSFHMVIKSFQSISLKITFKSGVYLNRNKKHNIKRQFKREP